MLATMASGSLTISGGWDDSFSFQVANAAANTRISPPAGQRGALFMPAGELVTVSDFEFHGAATALDGAGARVESTATASVHVLRNLFRSNTITKVGNINGAGLSVEAPGSGEVLVENNAFSSTQPSPAAMAW